MIQEGQVMDMKISVEQLESSEDCEYLSPINRGCFYRHEMIGVRK